MGSKSQDNDNKTIAPKGIWSFFKHVYRDISEPNADITNKYSAWVPFIPLGSFLLLLSAGFGAYLWFKQFGPLSFYVLGIEDTIYLTLVGIFWSILFLLLFFMILIFLLLVCIPVVMALKALGWVGWLPSDHQEGLIDWKASMNLARYFLLVLFGAMVIQIALVIGWDQVGKVVFDTVANALFFARESQSKWANWTLINQSIDAAQIDWIEWLNAGLFGVLIFFVLVAIAELLDHSNFHQASSRIFYLTVMVIAPCIGSYFYLDVMHPRQRVEVFYADNVNAASHVCADRETDSRKLVPRFETKMVWSGAKAALIECTRSDNKARSIVLVQGPENLRIQMRRG
jgi:hypothetical protein